jgi:hypothetical protein
VKSESGEISAVLALRMKPEAEFSSIFSVGRMGETGEAYAFDFKGVMLSASRFEEDLKAAGLLTNRPGVSTILNFRLAAPGDAREVRNKPPPEPALTRMAAAATAGWDGTDVNGYRLDLAKKLGATLAVNTKQTPLYQVQKQLGMKEGFDVGLEMSGNQGAFREMIDKNGQCCQPPWPIEGHVMIDFKNLIVGSHESKVLFTWNVDREAGMLGECIERLLRQPRHS